MKSQFQKYRLKKKRIVFIFVFIVIAVIIFIYAQKIHSHGMNEEQSSEVLSGKGAITQGIKNEKAQLDTLTDADSIFHCKVKIDYDYIPDAYEKASDGSEMFYYQSQDASGIMDGKVFGVTLYRINYGNSISINNISSISNVQVNGKNEQIYYISRKASGKSNDVFDKELILSFDDYGYVVQLFSMYNISEEELVKIAEGIHLEKSDAAQATVVSDGQNISLFNINKSFRVKQNEYIENTSDGNNFLDIHEAFYGVGNAGENEMPQNLQFTVEGYGVTNDASDIIVDDFDSEMDYQAFMDTYIGEDGQLLEYMRTVTNYNTSDGSEGEILENDIVDMKLVYVTIKVKNISAIEVTNADIRPFLLCLKECYDGYTTIWNKSGYGDDSKALENAFYCSKNPETQLEDTNNTEKFYNHNEYMIEPGEEYEYTVGYIVDSDRTNHMVLEFCHDAQEFDLSANSIKFVKLFYNEFSK